MGVVYSKGEPIRKVPTAELVDVLFEEIDKYYAAGRTVVRDEREAREGAEWLARIEAENAHDLTPERLAALEAEAARAEAESPVAGRRFTRT
jgi:(E)-4-hydroxy-3-methylbut-2-enyl-diphosphate synthase